MASGHDNTSGPGEDPVQSQPNLSTPTSPTDTRHPQGRFESVAAHDDGLSESYQSTDTVRRRPEQMSYGMQNQKWQFGTECCSFTKSYLKALYDMLLLPLPLSIESANHRRQAIALSQPLWNPHALSNLLDLLC